MRMANPTGRSAWCSCCDFCGQSRLCACNWHFYCIYVCMCALMSRASSSAPLADPNPRARRKQLPPQEHNRRILSVAASNFSPRRKRVTSHLNMSNGRSGSSHEARSRGNTDNKIHIHERAKPQSGIFTISCLINAKMDAAGRA